jgi:hypothetical protein
MPCPASRAERVGETVPSAERKRATFKADISAEEMTAWKVDSRVGNVRNDDERLLTPAGT